MSLLFASRLSSAVTAAVGTHFALSLASLAYSSGRFGGQSPLLQENFSRGRRSLPKEVFDASHYRFMTEFVSGIYSGKGAKHHPHVKLADSASFSDPAAICQGAPETCEAFRALVFLKPHALETPRCVDVTPRGESITLTFALNQRYQVTNAATIVLPSLLLVDVQLQQRQDVPESDFVVLRMEEQWNGVLPLSSYLFYFVRRINGIISYQLTKLLL